MRSLGIEVIGCHSGRMGVEAYHALQVRVGVRASVIDLKHPRQKTGFEKDHFVAESDAATLLVNHEDIDLAKQRAMRFYRVSWRAKPWELAARLPCT